MILQYPDNIPDIFFWGDNMYFNRNLGYVTFQHPDAVFPDPELEVRWPKPDEPMSCLGKKDILLSQLVAGSKKESAVLHELVLLHERRGDHTVAVPFYQRLMQINPGPQSQFFLSAGLGNELANATREKYFAAAARYFRAALDVVRPADQDTVCVSASFAECCNELGKHECAESCCRRALKVAGAMSAGIHEQLGLALEGQQRWREAARVYAAAEKYGKRNLFGISKNFSDLLSRRPELESEFGEVAHRFWEATDRGARLLPRGCRLEDFQLARH